MEIVYVGDRKPSNRALLISNEEWKRLGRILTKKTDEEVATQAGKRLKHLRREMSKKMVDGWDNTELVSACFESYNVILADAHYFILVTDKSVYILSFYVQNSPKTSEYYIKNITNFIKI